MATPAPASLPPGSRPMYPPQSIPGKPGAPELAEVTVTWLGEGPQALDSISIFIDVATEKGLITPIITNAAECRRSQLTPRRWPKMLGMGSCFLMSTMEAPSVFLT